MNTGVNTGDAGHQLETEMCYTQSILSERSEHKNIGNGVGTGDAGHQLVHCILYERVTCTILNKKTII